MLETVLTVIFVHRLGRVFRKIRKLRGNLRAMATPWRSNLCTDGFIFAHLYFVKNSLYVSVQYCSRRSKLIPSFCRNANRTYHNRLISSSSTLNIPASTEYSFKHFQKPETAIRCKLIRFLEGINQRFPNLNQVTVNYEADAGHYMYIITYLFAIFRSIRYGEWSCEFIGQTVNIHK